MQVSVEATGNLERRMTVKLPAERVEREVEVRLRSLGKTAKIKGFRPGKVPFKVVQQRFGGQVRGEVLDELLRSTYTEALIQENITPAGGLRIDTMNSEPGQDLEYTAIFEVYPEIELKGLDSIEVMRPVAEVSEDDIEHMLKNLRNQRATWADADRVAADGDRVTIDFEGDLAGEAFEGNSATDFPVTLGEGRMVEGFEAKLVGAEAGSELDFEIDFPEQYPAEDLVGKRVHFKVTVKKVEGKVLPELDEEFCKSFGVGDGGIEKLREEVAENMRREMGEVIRRKVKDQVLDELLKANEIEVPGSLIDDEIGQLRREAMSRMGMDPEKDGSELPREMFEEQAKRRVSLGLLIGEVIKTRDLKLDQDRVTKMLESMTESYETQADIIRSYRSNSNVMRQIETLVLEEQAVDWLLEQAKISDTPDTFRSLMKIDESEKS